MKAYIVYEKIKYIGIFLMLNGVLTFLSDIYASVGRNCFLVGVFLMGIYSLKHLPRIKKNGVLLWYSFFAVVMSFSVLYSIAPERSWELVCYIVPYHVITLIAIHMACNDEESLQKVISLYMIAAIILCIVVLKDGPISIKNPRYGWSTTGMQPNTPAMNLAPAFGFAYFRQNKNQGKNRVVLLFVMMLYVVTILLTGSRKILIFMVGIIILNSLYSSKDRRKTALKIVSAGIILLIGYVLLTRNTYLYDIVGSRVFTDLEEDASASQRKWLIEEAWKFFESSPIFGHGVHTFGTTNYTGRYAHNNFLELMTGMGIVGLVSYYGFLLFVLKRLWKQRLDSNCFMFFCILLMTIVVEYYNVNYMQRGIYVTYALAYCVYQITRNNTMCDELEVQENYEDYIERNENI